ncbi:MAG: GAF domain-containing protein [Armatimonadetes bacterium]|nr:GAF domain-containing protein [Armatimonadota bacterium]
MGALFLLFQSFPAIHGHLGELAGASALTFLGYLVVFRPARKGSYVCFVFPLILASVLLFGAKALFSVFPARFLATYVFSSRYTRTPFRFALLNASTDAIAVVLSALVQSSTSGLPFLLSAGATAGALWMAYNALESVHHVLRSGSFKREEILQAIRANSLDVALSPLGVLLALSYKQIGPETILLILIPLGAGFFVLRFAFQTQEEKREMDVLYDLTSDLNGNLELSNILSQIIRKSREVLGGERSAIFLPGKDRSGAIVSDPEDHFFLESLFFEPPLSRCLNKESVLTTDSTVVQGSLVAVPLEAQGRVLGVLAVHNKASGTLYEEHEQFLSIMAGHAARAIINAELFNETVEAHRKLAETQSQLVQSSKLAAVGQLAAGVAHEINNPLGAVLISAQGLQRTPGFADPRDKESLETIATGTKRCKEIVERLLRFSRLSDDSMLSFSVKEAIQDSLDLLSHQLALEGITLEWSLREDAEALGNPLEFSQAVTNLILNGRDAILEKIAESGISPPGGMTRGRIQVSLITREGIDLTVADNGSGISPDVLPRIFEPFYTTKEVGKGTGLGLALAYRAIEKMNGTIRVESSVGQGSTFVIHLPVSEAPVPMEPSIPAPVAATDVALRAMDFLKEQD